ncbi:hypothetical protein [Georgenia deserti]|uniref:DUF4190 domain-containing protein n=1 Tax=Georgenia deserti TaxID=2093781 RepID=A0ABW4L798_9MICO
MSTNYPDPNDATGGYRPGGPGDPASQYGFTHPPAGHAQPPPGFGPPAGPPPGARPPGQQPGRYWSSGSGTGKGLAIVLVIMIVGFILTVGIFIVTIFFAVGSRSAATAEQSVTPAVRYEASAPAGPDS